ncbi:DoxX family protein [Thalassomonas viridans]|uniref:DoxX family protein n=1 Tax=Thalassomonas viridans TaxID=137584 RepID=A0AAF0CAG4_9GAMM|nr:DoxX family protein [Thalassomonas viridans]WDE08547.1 DoxX family protein [Thalassomonas viridans]
MTLSEVRLLHNRILDFSHYLLSPANVLVRLYIASIFFKSGLTKLRDWESTLMLFEYEYEVPLLSPAAAAWSGTIGELVLPVLLAFGLFTRLSALGLFVVNYVAVLSLVDISPAALNQHILWGSLLLMLLLIGGERFSLDRKLKIS